jgi:hypothetical protein
VIRDLKGTPHNGINEILPSVVKRNGRILAEDKSGEVSNPQ